MSHFLLLAFRNVFRNRRRTMLTLFIVAGGVSALLLAGGFFALMFWGLRETTIQGGLGHLQVYNASFFDREERKALENGLTNYRTVAAAVEGTPHVKGVAPQIEFFGMASNGMKSTTYMAMGLDPAAEEKMGFRPRMVNGRNLAKGTDAYEAIVGTGLARNMNVKPGDGLTLLAVTADGALNGIDIDIVGVFTTGIKEMDDRALHLTLHGAQQLLQTDRVTKLVVGLDSTDNTDAVHKALLAKINRPDIRIKKWQELATFYWQVRSFFMGIFVFMCTIVFFMVIMSSANTLLMAMFERTREIGTMLAMGTPRSWIMRLFLAEGLLTGVLGAVLGLLVGNGLGLLLNALNIQVPPPPGNLDGFPLRVLFVPKLMVGSSLMVIFTLAAASLLPSVRASRLKIVESLAHI